MKTIRAERSLIRRRWLGALLLVVLGCLAGPGLAQTSRFGSVTIQAIASPRSVPADGQTRSRLRVEVRDNNGAPVHDGTLVVIHTDLGSLTTNGADRSSTVSLTTQGGYVAPWVVSDTPGTALVTINVVDSRTQAFIDFLPPGQAGMVETHIVRIGGGWVGYATDLNEVEARDNAWARFGKVRLEGADDLQLDVERMILRGGPAKLTDGQHTLEAQDVYLDLQSKHGAARVVNEQGVQRLVFDLYTLEPRTMEWQPPEDAFNRQRESSATWLKAKEITVFSHEKIVFRGGALYTEKDKVLSLPRIWIMALPGYTGESNNQLVGLNSTGGIAVRLPYFISAGSTTTDSVQIEKGASASSVVARSDWALGLSHEYRNGGVGGAIEASGLPLSDWGMRWRDSRVFNNGAQSDLDLASPDHRSLFFDSNYYAYGNGRSMNLRTYYQRPVGFDDTFGASAEWLTDPQRLGQSHALAYRLGASVGVQKGGLEEDNNSPQMVTGLYSFLDCAPLRLGPKTSLVPGVSNVFSWNSPGFQSNVARGQLRLEQTFGQLADLSLCYSGQLTSGDLGGHGWDHMLTADARYYHGTSWMLFGSGSMDLTSGDWFSYATWDYYLSNNWRMSLLGTWYQQQAQDFNDQEIYVGTKVFQDREIGLSWSRQTNRIAVELVGLTNVF